MPDVPDLAALREAGGLLYLDALVGDSQHIYVRRDVAIKATDGIAAVLSLVEDMRAENERLREGLTRLRDYGALTDEFVRVTADTILAGSPAEKETNDA